MSTTGWTPARSTTEQRRSASWELASADVPWPDWPWGELNLATLELLGRETDLTYIATLCRAGLIRIEIFEQRLDATDIDTAKPETGCECKPRRTRRRRGGPDHRSQGHQRPRGDRRRNARVPGRVRQTQVSHAG